MLVESKLLTFFIIQTFQTTGARVEKQKTKNLLTGCFSGSNGAGRIYPSLRKVYQLTTIVLVPNQGTKHNPTQLI